MKNVNFIHTIEDKCLGCNKCIFKCPVNAHEAFYVNHQNKVHVREGFCISCGECMEICDHNARDFIDDTQRFFTDLKKGEKITVVIAPSYRFNIDNINKLIAYLKSLGVNQVHDVSFGADICTWAHLKHIKKEAPRSLIAQPCPVVVSYVEKYHPELIPNLSPIHSPVVCHAVYLKKYKKSTDKIAFISPCIGKKREVMEPNTNGLLEYNITFEKIVKYLKDNNIDLMSYEDIGFDSVNGSLGFAFPRPGGLSENIKYHLGEDVWIKTVEGILNIEDYFKQYIQDLKRDEPVPLIVDALNCEHGCNFGTGGTKVARYNNVDFSTNKKKSDIKIDDTKKLMNLLDTTLQLKDFIRVYDDKSEDYKEDENIDLESAYISLGKFTEEDRRINCFSCGFGTCHEFVVSMATGHNHKNNCKHYLLNKFKQLSLVDDFTGTKNRYSYTLAVDEISKNHSGFVGILFADINGLKQANDKFGHNFGDTIILRCAQLLKTVFKDKVYRVGGDEFIVLDDSSDKTLFNQNVQVLDELLKKEENLVVSVGVSSSYSNIDLEDKIDLADKIMYEAKQSYYDKYKTQDRRKNR